MPASRKIELSEEREKENKQLYYPPPSFHFRVVFQFPEVLKFSPVTSDAHFQSVSGLNVEMETESIREGGENRFEHVIPTRTRYQDLILKRGVVKDSAVIQWCRRAVEAFQIAPINLLVQLLNEDHDTLVQWDVVHAWPKKWSVSDLNAEQNELLIETLELSYNFFTINHSAPLVDKSFEDWMNTLKSYLFKGS